MDFAVGNSIIAAILAVFTLIAAAFGCFCTRSAGTTVTGGSSGGSGGSGISRRRGHGRHHDRVRQIQDRVYEKYKKLLPRGKVSFNDFCFPSSYKLQPQQKFMASFASPAGRLRECLVFHKIGAGKSCVAIQICLKWISRCRPLVVMPASLITGFYNELRTKCAGDMFITDAERAALAAAEPGSAEYNDIILESNRKIDAAIRIMSYNKFNTGAPAADIIIVDEVQNILNTSGLTYRTMLGWIERNKDAAVVLMSGTPVFDSPDELRAIARLMRRPPPESPADVGGIFAGAVSYFPGAPDYTYPTATVSVKQCVFSPFQAKWYKSQTEAERRGENLRTHNITNNFYIKSRQRSDVVYPNGVGRAAAADLTTAHLTTNLATYSAKVAALVKKLSKRELHFVYSNFTTTLDFIRRVLIAHGWSDFDESGPGRKRFAIWSGDTTQRGKDVIRATFNSPANDDGSQLRVVLGSPSIKEGVSLLRLRYIHVLEASWNHPRLEQIFGRGVRYCSHKTLPRSEREVSIYIYAGVTRRVTAAEMASVQPETSIDLYMLSIADKKMLECSEYIDALIDCAADKLLWQ